MWTCRRAVSPAIAARYDVVGGNFATRRARHPGRDAGTMTCMTDADCDDQKACNGHERCAPHSPGADARGCVSGSPMVCPVNQICAEGRGCVGRARPSRPDRPRLPDRPRRLVRPAALNRSPQRHVSGRCAAGARTESNSASRRPSISSSVPRDRAAAAPVCPAPSLRIPPIKGDKGWPLWPPACESIPPVRVRRDAEAFRGSVVGP